ncbi:MAG TPA: AAA family ATPase [Candidatus Wunengus sp. YC60]|uniref:AAA family ATPase n=1 Tax=Candidatus Wunengus sp. YC60 TaxID=3367697 RepID=UPI004028C4FB
MKITKLTIRGFRGFNEQQSIPLDSNVILIYGLNGSGKSSFTEALEWLFFGEISRQRLSRCRSEYQYEEYLKNLFYTDTGNPFVEIEGVLNGRNIKIKKEIGSDGEKLFVDDKEFPDLNALNLNLESYFRPMLAQTEIKALVDSEQKDRWEQLSSILGQDELTKLRENLISLRNNKKKDDNYKKQELKWQSILSDISESQPLSQLTHAIQDLDSVNLLSGIKNITGSSTNNLQDILKEIRIKQKSLLNTEIGKRVTEVCYLDALELSKYLKELSESFIKLEEHSIASTKEGHDHDYLGFLKNGLDFVKLPECPYCLEKTLIQERLDAINKKLELGKGAQEAKNQFDQLKNSINLWMLSFPERIKSYLPSQQELKIISQKFIDIEESELAVKVQNIEKEIATAIASFHKELKSAIDECHAYLETRYFHKGTADENIPKKLSGVIQKIIFQQNDIISKWEDLKREIAKSLSLTGVVNQEEIKKWLALEKITSFFINSGEFIKCASLLKQVDVIQAKLEQYEKSEITRLLQEHATEIKAYYEKLNPGDKIQFSGIEVKGGVRRQAKLSAEAFGKAVNPVTFFSEAHTNSLALSIYFPQRVDRNNTWEVVILDDPVQSMDENHSQALIDILVDISAKKQMIVLTHSKSFFRRLCARLGHLKPKVFLFHNNDEKGPSICLDKGETLSYLSLIEENCKKGDLRSLETASQHLRKSIESVCLEFLLDKGISFSKAQKLQNAGLQSSFAECEKLGLPASETGKLKSVLDTSHSDSHAWSIADTTVGGIRTGKKYVQDIYDTYLK